MTDKKYPTPEEVHREFEDFVKNRFGDSVKIFAQHMNQTPAPDTIDAESKTATKNFSLDFTYKPRDIKTYLDRFVVKQDEAKKALAIAVCDHYNHVRQCHENPKIDAADYSKQNILVLGPTGVGKTYLVRQIARLIGVPFVKADATRFSETGYVGGNVDDLVHDLVAQADGDIELAQYGIIYLDEADKLASAPGKGGRDVSGRGVQFGLLKLMEETEVDLRAGNDMKSQMQAFMEFQQRGKVEKKIVNTKHILFIISGAFTGLVDIIKSRLNANSIGFGFDNGDIKSDNDYFDYAKTQDFVEFGFEPEFIGRLPVQVACHDLSAADLYDVMKKSEGSIIRQYESTFRAYGIEAVFADDGLREIAERAHQEKTGARGLMSVCEKFLRDFKFELPSLNIQSLRIDKEAVKNNHAVLAAILRDPRYKPAHPLKERVLRFSERFYREHRMRLRFTDEAVDYACTRAAAEGRTPEDLCQDLLKSYEHGLKLVQQNTGKSDFLISAKALQDPAANLEIWIKESYGKSAIILGPKSSAKKPAPTLGT